MGAGMTERTLRGRLELRNAREHRRVERLFRAAQEARNAVIEDFRPARAWNLRELRRQRRVDPAKGMKSCNFRYMTSFKSYETSRRSALASPGKRANTASAGVLARPDRLEIVGLERGAFRVRSGIGQAEPSAVPAGCGEDLWETAGASVCPGIHTCG